MQLKWSTVHTKGTLQPIISTVILLTTVGFLLYNVALLEELRSSFAASEQVSVNFVGNTRYSDYTVFR